MPGSLVGWQHTGRVQDGMLCASYQRSVSAWSASPPKCGKRGLHLWGLLLRPNMGQTAAAFVRVAFAYKQGVGLLCFCRGCFCVGCRSAVQAQHALLCMKQRSNLKHTVMLTHPSALASAGSTFLLQLTFGSTCQCSTLPRYVKTLGWHLSDSGA